MGIQENVLAVEKKSKMAAKSKMVVICARSNNKLISYSTEYKQIHDLCVYNMVFGYAQHSGVARKYYFKLCISGKITDARHLFKVTLPVTL